MYACIGHTPFTFRSSLVWLEIAHFPWRDALANSSRATSLIDTARRCARQGRSPGNGFRGFRDGASGRLTIGRRRDVGCGRATATEILFSRERCQLCELNTLNGRGNMGELFRPFVPLGSHWRAWRCPTTGALAAEPKAATVRLVVDYGDGAQVHFTALPWREGMTVLDALGAAQAHPHGITFSQRGSAPAR